MKMQGSFLVHVLTQRNMHTPEELYFFPIGTGLFSSENAKQALKKSADDILKYFSYFFSENRL